MDKKRKAKKKLEFCTPKKKSYASNFHLICDKQAVVQLERLSDSVVAEMTAGCSALPPDKVNEANADSLDINSFPNEIIFKIFGYLEQNHLGKMARVCRRWNKLAKDPVFWKKVKVKFSPSHRSQTTVAKSFINGLPSSVTFIKLDFTECSRWTATLDFEQLCAKLEEKQPHLKELILSNTKLSESLPGVIDLCMQFLQNVRKLVFNHCIYPTSSERILFSAPTNTSKIEVLEVSGCVLGGVVSPRFSRLPCLKVLCLSNTNVYLSWFSNDISFLRRLCVLDLGQSGIPVITFLEIMYHGINLKELYVCKCDVGDSELNFNSSTFPHLKTICLSRTRVTCECVVSLIQSCPSLENVYVDEYVADFFAAHSFVAANRCKSGIVKSIDPIHKHNVGYSYT